MQTGFFYCHICCKAPVQYFDLCFCIQSGVGEKLFDIGSHSLAEVSGPSQISLTLGGFKSELVAAVHMVELHLTAFSYGESFCGSAVCFNFSHDLELLSFCSGCFGRSDKHYHISAVKNRCLFR